MERGKATKMRRGSFFLFFCFVFVLFFAFHFSKPLKFALGAPKWEFSTEKKHFMPGKNSGKMTLSPLKNFPLTPLVASTFDVTRSIGSCCSVLNHDRTDQNTKLKGGTDGFAWWNNKKKNYLSIIWVTLRLYTRVCIFVTIAKEFNHNQYIIQLNRYISDWS